MLNMDFTQFVRIDTNRQDWTPSPMPGVDRKPLAREEAERGHATSIVRYQPGSRFSEHNHPGGEEILVLQGTFSDATGDFHAGTYFRNPVGFVHAPFSEPGCIILVKLHQFQAQDRERVCIETAQGQWLTRAAGVEEQALHEFGSEKVRLLRLDKDALWEVREAGPGAEILVIQGRVSDNHGLHPAGTWLRYPAGMSCQLQATTDCLLWLKTGHLPL